MTSSLAASASRSRLHDLQGATIRCFHRFMEDGRTAAILVGSHFPFGSHEPGVSAQPLPFLDEMIMPENGIIQALNY